MTVPRVYKAEGIILKRKNIGEADRILTVFTKEYGKIRAVAKGIRKTTSRRAPHLEVFNRAAIVFHVGKTLDHLSEVTTLDAFERLRTDLARVSMAYYIAELIDSLLPERQEHPEVYAQFCAAMSSIQNGASAGIYKTGKDFTLTLLWTLGFLPEGKILTGQKLQDFIETITERRIKSTDFAKLLIPDNA
jgi:DNA repair protein RecO (recombination protein O)